MEDNKQKEDVSSLVKRWLPHASDEELVAATANFRRYLAVAFRVYERLEREGKLACLHDKPALDARVDLSNNKEI